MKIWVANICKKKRENVRRLLDKSAKNKRKKSKEYAKRRIRNKQEILKSNHKIDRDDQLNCRKKIKRHDNILTKYFNNYFSSCHVSENIYVAQRVTDFLRTRRNIFQFTRLMNMKYF